MLDSNEALYRKVFYQAARRAMLENENVMRSFMSDVVLQTYSYDKLKRLDVMLIKIFDKDLFDIIMGQKKPADLKELYDLDILEDINNYAITLRSI